MTEPQPKSGTTDVATSPPEYLRFRPERSRSHCERWRFRQSKANLRLAYMTGQYPRVTDTFIQREVATLRGPWISRADFSVRKPPDTESVGSENGSREELHYLSAASNRVVRAHFVQLLSSPRRYFSALALAARNCPPGLRATARQVAYFAEAGMLARLMKKHSLAHLHNHLSDSSCSVAAIAAEIGGFTFSFTMHGPAEFYEPKLWWIDEKVRRALFCKLH